MRWYGLATLGMWALALSNLPERFGDWLGRHIGEWLYGSHREEER